MDFKISYVVLIFTIFIGCTKAGTPYISNTTCNNTYSTKAEDFLGVLCSVRVQDRDAEDHIKCFSDDDLTAQYFNLSQKRNGNDVWIDFFVEKELDRETLGSMIKMNILLSDDQHNQIKYDHTVYITDVNDNNPQFQDLPYALEIDELPCNKTKVYSKIIATDKDSGQNGRVTYSLEPKSQLLEVQKLYSETFTINPVTGEVSLTECLDYEINNYYHFVVVATDHGPNGGLNSTAELVINVKDVQDQPPFFTGVYRKTIHGSVARGTDIVQVHAVDGDQVLQSKINYSIIYSSCGGGLFKINNETGVVTTLSDVSWNSGAVRQNMGYCIVTIDAIEIQDETEKQYGNTTTSTDVIILLQDYGDHTLNPNSISEPSFTKSEVSTRQPYKETSPVHNCTEQWNFQSPCNESAIRAGVTRFPHPSSKHMFLICDEFGKTYLAYCPPNEIFHAGCSKCASPEQNFSASCVVLTDGFVNPCSKESVRAGNLTFPHPSSSTKYIRCDTLGNAWEEDCLSGSVWDQTNLRCTLPPANNPCHQHGSIVQTLYPHYCNHRLYVHCENSGIPIVHACQKNYVFLNWDSTCVPPGFPGSEHLRNTCD